MDERGRLTPEDGERYIDFCEKWGETPQGKKLKSCSGCGRIIGHTERCPGDSHQSYEERLWQRVVEILR